MAFSNAKPVWPELFHVIIKTDNELAAMKEAAVTELEAWREAREYRRGLSRDAENMLRWNTNKGNKK